MPLSLQSDTGALKKVIVKPARDAFLGPARLAAEWQSLRFTGCPDYARACAESEEFSALLRRLGVEVLDLPRDEAQTIDSIYARDAGVVCDRGLILCSMGKATRRTEPAALRRAAEVWGVPIAGEISGAGRLEGGDVAWVDARTLAVAHGYRTNPEGIRQLRALLGDCVDEVVVVPLPHYRGPDDVFHLMSVYSPLAPDLALVHSPLMPVPFRELLLARGIRLVEVAPEELDTLGCNVLAVAPRVCVLAAGNPLTKRRLVDAGCEVHEFAGDEIAQKGGGGPTCLTRPLDREV
jgi:N-dimethylarginine dimethylaminohydrolase